METYLTPALVVAAAGFLWRVLGKRIDDLRDDIRELNRTVADIDRRLARVEGTLYGHREPADPE